MVCWPSAESSCSAGALLLVDAPIPEMRVHLLTALAVAFRFGLITVFLMSVAVKARRNKVVTGIQGLVGEVGIAQTALSSAGQSLRTRRALGCGLVPSVSLPANQ